MNRFLKELCDWLDKDRFGKKVLFARNLTTGNQLLRMAAAHGTPAVNVQATSVLSYLEEMAHPGLAAQNLQKADSVTASMALRELMIRAGDEFTTLGVVELSTAESVLPMLEELEMNQVQPAQLRDLGENLLADLWQSFINWRRDNGYALIQDMLTAASIPDGTSYAVLSNLPLSSSEKLFLDSIPEGKLTVIHIAVPEGAEIPRSMLLQRGIPRSGIRKRLECVSCQDIGTEIRAAYQYLVENMISAEDAVIVCPDASYGLRAEEEGKLLGIGVNSSFGMPASMTNTSLLISCMTEWARNNYDAETLRPVLVSGGMALYNDQNGIEMNGQALLRVFREQAVGWGKDRWQALARSDEPRFAAAGRLMTSWISFFETKSDPVRKQAANLSGLLQQCMARGPENEMFLKLADEISRMYSGSMEPVAFLDILNAAASSQTVGAHTTDEPGKVYCCNCENAMYVNRRHFVFLGMSWDAFDHLSGEFPLLHDREKTMLSPLLRLAGDGAQQRRYAVLELLANREDAEIRFSSPGMDYIGGSEIMAASLFDDAAAQYPEGEPPKINILGRSVLTELDAHLKAGYYPDDTAAEMDPGRRVLWEQAFKERRWSATRLETAAGCPRRFTLSVQMGIDKERPEALEQFGQVWLSGSTRGDLIHEVLQEYFSATAPRLDQPDRTLLESCVNAAIERYKKKVPVPSNLTDITPEKEAILELVMQAAGMHADDRQRETIGTEVGFGREQPFTLIFGNHEILLNGSIDRVDHTPAGIEIIDYKSGAAHRFRQDFNHKLQYYLYTLAWEKLHPDQPVRKASYYILDAPGGIESIDIDMTDDVCREMYEKIKDLLDLLADPETAMTPACMMGLTPEEAAGTPVSYEKCPSYCPFLNLCAETMIRPENQAGGADD